MSLAGLGLLLLGVAVVAASVVSGLAGWGFGPVLWLVAAGLVLLVVGVGWLRSSAYVVRLDHLGYRVRLLRGVGVTRARWADVADASTAIVGGHPCVVISLRDGQTTTIPVSVLATGRDEFVTELRGHLRTSR